MDLLEDVLERLSVYGAAKFVEYIASSETLVSIGLNLYCTHVKLIILKSEV